LLDTNTEITNALIVNIGNINMKNEERFLQLIKEAVKDPTVEA
jgi:hydroxyethylthiazole kinase-like sugar kinase family protein